jgi:hypothetical protein
MFASRKFFGINAIAILLPAFSLFAAAPALRDQVSLNGTWQYDGTNSITVPHETNQTFDTRTYTRSIQIPATWTGKTIMVDFEAVNHSCSLFVDNHFVMEHIGAFIPFSANIASLVQPGNTYQLKVNVRGSRVLPTNDNLGPIWPIGKCGTETVTGAEAGLYDQIWLRAYGQVAIVDAFIQTSYRTKMLRVEYTVKNFGATPRTVTIAGDVTPSTGGASVKTLQSSAVTVAAGDSALMVCEVPWTDAELWNPDHPFLYHLTSQLREGTATVDQEVRRFGFKEMWIVGNQYYLNGNRVNLYGDNIVESENYSANGISAQSVWPSSIDQMKAVNIRYSRFHSHPTRSWVTEIADEKGFMILEETALYARAYYNRNNIGRVLGNMVNTWIPAWVRAKRNHPSIVMWSAENEMQAYLALLSAAEVQELEKTILLYDPSRPVSSDGELDFSTMVYNSHYVIEGAYQNTFTGPNIYAFLPRPAKPSGSGEFLTSYGANGEENKWWHGTIIRGLRFTNWTDIRPYQMKWAWTGATAPQHTNQVQSWAKVALFDSAYDNLKLAPVRDGVYPSVNEGSTMARRLVVYNDEFSDPFVTITVDARQNLAVYATASKTIRLPLGEHIMVPCTLQAPYTGTTGSAFDMVLKTSKNGVNKFTEARTFTLNDLGADATPSAIIRLGIAEATNLTSPYITCAPDTLAIKAMRGVPPPSCIITAANQGSGTLDNVAAQVNYVSGADWLTVQTTGQGNSQALPVTFNTSALAAGTYAAAIAASCANASNGFGRCGISMTIVEGQNPDSIANVAAGLNYNAYEKFYNRGENLGVLTSLTPVKSGIAAVPNADLRTREYQFALRFTGYLRVTQPGAYTITLSSIEGSRMWVHNTLLVENGQWLFRAKSKSGTAYLKPGLHSIAIDYCDDSAYQELKVYWEGPGINGMQLIPASAFYHGDAVKSIVPQSARAANKPFLSPLARNGRLMLRYGAPKGLPVHIDVVDLAGRNVRTIDIKESVAGVREAPLILPGGQYFVRMRAGKTSLLSRVIVAK